MTTEKEEPYCDVCGNSGSGLRSPVEVCRDCYDVARDAERSRCERIVQAARMKGGVDLRIIIHQILSGGEPDER
jgi:hypothetical protein